MALEITTDSTRPRIGIDGYNLAMPNGTGVATYARTLSQCVSAMGYPVDVLYGLDVGRGAVELRETLFFDALDGNSAESGSVLARRWRRAMLGPSRRTAVHVPITGNVVATGFEKRMPMFDRLFNLKNLFEMSTRYFRRYRRFMSIRVADPPSIMHWTYPLPIRMLGARNLYTVHDLVPLRLPHTTLDNKREYHSLIRTCLAQGDHVCTVSQASRRDILTLFPDADPARVTNTYQAVARPEAALALSEEALGARLRNLFGVERGGYFLFFGALEPKKNLGRLIEAYLTAELKTPLVIVGARSWKAEQELRLLAQVHGRSLKGASQILQFEYLPSILLMQLVRGARAVVFPSIYEGFGLPVLEAMLLGTPVLTSNTSALPEVVADAALTVDPYDVSAISAGLTALDGDEDLRRRLSAKGRVQAELFSMDVYAQRVDALYAQVLRARPDVAVRHRATLARRDRTAAEPGPALGAFH